MLSSLFDFDVWIYNSSVWELNLWTTHEHLIVVVKTWIEPATLSKRTDNRDRAQNITTQV